MAQDGGWEPKSDQLMRRKAAKKSRKRKAASVQPQQEQQQQLQRRGSAGTSGRKRPAGGSVLGGCFLPSLVSSECHQPIRAQVSPTHATAS